MTSLRISLVVPNLNYGRFLRPCLESIARQTQAPFEVTMIDGGSRDESQEIMREYAARFGWRMEVRQDLGQAASIAWGLQIAQGEIVGWLNSDDFYLNRRTLEHVTNRFADIDQLEMYSGGGYYVDGEGRFLRAIRLNVHPLYRQTAVHLRAGFCQPSTFWRSNVMQSVPIDTSYRYIFDAAFFVGVCQRHNTLIEPEVVLAAYRLHGANLSAGIKADRIREQAIFHQLNSPGSGRSIILHGIAIMVAAIHLLPQKVARGMLQVLYHCNNYISYATIYRWPSI